MFKVYINDGSTPIPNDDICYIVAKEGIFLKKKVGIMESIAPVQNISILESVNSMAKMNIKKLPGSKIANIIAFFKGVYQKYHGEAIVLLFYDENNKVYKIVPPHQKVTGASCDYDKGIVIEGMQMIGTIHSHGAMSAFHSGVDDADETHFDGLHITIGNVNNDSVSISASIVANGHRFVVEPEEYIERLQLISEVDETETIPSRKIYKWVDGKLVEDIVETNKYTYSFRKHDKQYKVNVSEKYHRFPSSWLEMVERGSYVYTYSPYSWGGWGSNYDPSLWNGYRNLPQTRVQNPLNVGPSATTIPITFPPHDIEIPEDINSFPCQTCIYRTCKFLAEEEQIDDEPSVFQCKKCNTLVTENIDDELGAICPKCNTDEYLIQLEEDELPSQYIKETIEHNSGQVPYSQYITCKMCGVSYHMFEGDSECPFCGSSTDNNLYENEDTMEQFMVNDSGGYLTNELNDIRSAALEQAKQEQIIEKIPDPNESSIPINEKEVYTSEKSLIKKLFNSMFLKSKGNA